MNKLWKSHKQVVNKSWPSNKSWPTTTTTTTATKLSALGTSD